MNVEVQDEQLQRLKVTPDRLRLEMAAGLYATEEVTLGQAAPRVIHHGRLVKTLRAGYFISPR